jgi:hypothetical protein
MPSRKRKCFAGTTYDFDAECCVGEGRFRVVVKVRHRVRRLRTTVKAAAIKSPHDATERRTSPLTPASWYAMLSSSRHAASRQQPERRELPLRDYVTDELSLVMQYGSTEYVRGRQSLQRLLGASPTTSCQLAAHRFICSHESKNAYTWSSLLYCTA